jgi:hypothetical protein
MASEYVNLCTLEVDGKTFSDFDSFTDNSVIVAKTVNLMNKTGFANMTPRYGFSISVKKPYTGEISLDKVKNGTLTVEYDDGDRILYSGVYTLETGDAVTDGETELTMTKVFGAANKEKETN